MLRDVGTEFVLALPQKFWLQVLMETFADWCSTKYLIIISRPARFDDIFQRNKRETCWKMKHKYYIAFACRNIIMAFMKTPGSFQWCLSATHSGDSGHGGDGWLMGGHAYNTCLFRSVMSCSDLTDRWCKNWRHCHHHSRRKKVQMREKEERSREGKMCNSGLLLRQQ